jgi:hypothetical protein
MSKIVGMMLCGTAWAATPQVTIFANAIAEAEGFGTRGTIPTRCHNPGDLKGTKFPGEVGLCKGGHAHFKNDSAGWAALYDQIDKMLSGTSHVYHTSMTFRDVARLYAGNSRVWLKNITRVMAIPPDTSLAFYFTLNRENYVTEDLGLWDFNAVAGMVPFDATTAMNVAAAVDTSM